MKKDIAGMFGIKIVISFTVSFHLYICSCHYTLFCLFSNIMQFHFLLNVLFKSKSVLIGLTGGFILLSLESVSPHVILS